jgi:hypothetical protein
MRHDCNALFRTLVEPHEKLDGTFATMLIGFTFVRVKHVLVVPDFRKIKVGKLGCNFGNGPTSVADIVSPPFSALFSHQKTRWRHLNSGGALQ